MDAMTSKGRTRKKGQMLVRLGTQTDKKRQILCPFRSSRRRADKEEGTNHFCKYASLIEMKIRLKTTNMKKV